MLFECVLWRGGEPGAETQSEQDSHCLCSLPCLNYCQFIKVKWLELERVLLSGFSVEKVQRKNYSGVEWALESGGQLWHQ